MAMSDAMRAAVIAAVLLAGSCTAPASNQGYAVMDDPTINHPIVVDAATKSVRLGFTAADAGLMPEDAVRFDAFVTGYQTSGSGAITVTVPEGPAAKETITYFGERLAAAGVPRNRIVVGTRSGADSDWRVELSYTGYVAHTDKCGLWLQDANDTETNLPMSNFGCAAQHNIAAQLDNPRDVVEPRASGPTDPMRRSTVIGAYQKGQTTSATKTSDQSVAVSDVKN